MALLLLNCYDKNNVDGIVTQSSTIKLTDKKLLANVVYTGLKFPTSMTFLKDDDILVLEKNNGTVERIINGQKMNSPLLDLNVATEGERGLLGITSNITMEDSGKKLVYVFLYLTESKDHDGGDDENGKPPLGNRIYRYELSENGSKLVNSKLLIDLPAGPQSWHNGGRIVIGPDKNLYFIVGDMGGSNFTVTNSIKGIPADGRAGILHTTQNVDTVSDDFQLGEKNLAHNYYAYGIRNGFGLDFDPVTGNLWDSELGPNFGDEINMVAPNFNSGWSQVQGIWKGNGSSANFTSVYSGNLVSPKGIGNYSQPELTVSDETGFTAIKFLNSDKLGEEYRNTLFLGDFHSGKLYNFQLDDDRDSLVLGPDENPEKIISNSTGLDSFLFGEGFGGIVDIQVGPDGYLYILSLYQGGDNCFSENEIEGKDCVNYSSKVPGTIFKIENKAICDHNIIVQCNLQ